MATWREYLEELLKAYGETFDDVVASTFKNCEMDIEFDPGYGGTEGVPFTLWTKKRVYFPAEYDGAEWVDSVPRDPCDEITSHVGGG